MAGRVHTAPRSQGQERPTPELRQAAIELGATYACAHGDPRRWIVPTPGRAPMEQVRALLCAYGELLRAPNERRQDISVYLQRYAGAFTRMVPPLEREARQWAKATLASNDAELERIAVELAASGTALRLQEAAKRAHARLRAQGRSELEERYAEARRRGTPVSRMDWRPVGEERYGEAVRKDTDELFKILYHARGAGPRFVRLLYTRPEEGLAWAKEHVADARDGVEKFRKALAEKPTHIWRYPPIVVGGVGRLGLADVPGFPHYAVALAGVLAKDPIEALVADLGLVLLCVGIVFTGPVGAAMVGALDLALSGASFALTYMREREQDLAATASQMRPAAERLAEPPKYLETAAAAVGLLTAAAVLRRGGAMRELARREAKPLAAIPAPPPTVKRPPEPVRRPVPELADAVLGTRATGDRALTSRGGGAKGPTHPRSGGPPPTGDGRSPRPPGQTAISTATETRFYGPSTPVVERVSRPRRAPPPSTSAVEPVLGVEKPPSITTADPLGSATNDVQAARGTGTKATSKTATERPPSPLARGSNDPVLNIGSGQRPIEGAINLDVESMPRLDVRASGLELPFRDGSIGKVMLQAPSTNLVRPGAIDVLVEEIGRVLKPGGRVEMIVGPLTLPGGKTIYPKQIVQAFKRGGFTLVSETRLPGYPSGSVKELVFQASPR